MVALGLCSDCQPVPIGEPTHCYGRNDRPAPNGMIGGFHCACSCRYRQKKDR